MPDNHGPCVLLVHDPRGDRDLVRRLVARGYRCLVAASTEEVLAQAEHCDAVLMDLDLPGLGGLGCLRALRQVHGLDRLPVIVLTGQDGATDAVQALAAGASDYVARPVDSPVLLARLKTWLALKELRDTREHFMRIASHDLRNPLTRILTTTDLVRELVPPGATMPPEIHALLGGVGDAAMRMSRIIEDFVDLQAIQDGAMSLDLEPVDVGELLEPALERQATWAREKGISLAVQGTCTAQVLADLPRLEQVIDNLVSNAVKYSRAGTTVRLRCYPEGNHAVVEVIDQGPGLTAADLERVFERYARLSARPTAGEASSGLGLSIARELVERHGGEIGVRNNSPQPGATFWFRLPLAVGDR